MLTLGHVVDIAARGIVELAPSPPSSCFGAVGVPAAGNTPNGVFRLCHIVVPYVVQLLPDTFLGLRSVVSPPLQPSLHVAPDHRSASYDLSGSLAACLCTSPCLQSVVWLPDRSLGPLLRLSLYVVPDHRRASCDLSGPLAACLSAPAIQLSPPVHLSMLPIVVLAFDEDRRDVALRTP